MPRSLTTHIDSPKAFGQRLIQARAGAGLSQRQLAFPGCTAAYISRLEAGARTPSMQLINELAERLDVPAKWLATGDPGHLSSGETITLTNAQHEVLKLFEGTTTAEREYLGHMLRAYRTANPRSRAW